MTTLPFLGRQLGVKSSIVVVLVPPNCGNMSYREPISIYRPYQQLFGIVGELSLVARYMAAIEGRALVLFCEGVVVRCLHAIRLRQGEANLG